METKDRQKKSVAAADKMGRHHRCNRGRNEDEIGTKRAGLALLLKIDLLEIAYLT